MFIHFHKEAYFFPSVATPYARLLYTNPNVLHYLTSICNDDDVVAEDDDDPVVVVVVVNDDGKTEPLYKRDGFST